MAIAEAISDGQRISMIEARQPLAAVLKALSGLSHLERYWALCEAGTRFRSRALLREGDRQRNLRQADTLAHVAEQILPGGRVRR
jgi:hypothetical protein